MRFEFVKKRRAATILERASSGVIIELLEMRRMLSGAPATQQDATEQQTARAIALMAAAKPASLSSLSAGSSSVSTAATGGSADKARTTSAAVHSVRRGRFNIRIVKKAEDSGDGGGDEGGGGGDGSGAPTGATTAPGGDGANSAKSPQGGDPVRLSDGTLDFQVTDLQSNAFSSPFGQVRSWTNNPVYVSSISSLGNGWTLTDIPTLVQPEGQWGPQMILENGSTADWFTSTFSWQLAKPLPPAADYPNYPYLLYTYVPPKFDGGTDTPIDNYNNITNNYTTGNPNYVPPPIQGDIPGEPYTSEYYVPTPPVYAPQFDNGDSLAYSSNNYTYTWQTPQGDRYVFNASGRLQTYYSPLGGSTTSFYYNSSGISEVDRTASDGSLTEKWLYSYIDSGPNNGELGSVTLEREGTGISAPPIVDSVAYQYYDGTTDGGNLNDLEDAIVTDPSGNVLSETYYRYYLPGQADG